MDNATIKIACELCAAAYQPSDTRFSTIGELRLGVNLIDGIVHITNRGTDNCAGWVDDVEFIPTEDFDGSVVHLGWWRCTMKLMPPISKALALVDPLNLPIAVGGHSLGGALAGMITKRLVAAGFDAEAVTFGCPQYQFELGKEPTSITHYRIINRLDPVVNVPPDALGWRHTVKPFLDVFREGDHLSVDRHCPVESAYLERLPS